MSNNAVNKEWRNFEKRREDALRAGYGQPPVNPHSGITPSPNINVGWNIDQKSSKPGYEHGSFYNASVYPGQVPSPAHAWNPPLYDSQGVAVVNEKYNHDQTHRRKSSVDEEFEGPLRKRKCRDVICLAIFAVFLGLMAVVAGYALWTGSYSRLVPGGTRAKCGDYDLSPLGFVTGDVKVSPNLDLPPAFEPFINTSSIDHGFFDKVAAEFKESWPNVVYMCLIALALAILMTVFLRLFADAIIWTIVGVFVVSSIGCTIALWVIYSRVENASSGSFGDKHRKEIFLGLASVVSIITILVLLILLILRKRIALVARLFKEAGKAVHAVPLVLIQPVWTFLCQALAGCIFVALAALIETSETKDSRSGECKKSSFAQASRWLNIFGYIWMTQFIMGCQHLVVAGAMSQWFFTRDKSKLSFPLLVSFKNLVRYHLGSIAVGSAIIAVVKFIRFLLNQLKKRLGGVSKIVQCLLCCCQCCLWCLDNVLTFLNRNAYIEIAIYGYAFCPSAKRAYKVIVSNALRISAINSIGDFVLFLAKLTICGLTVVCGYYIFESDLNDGQSLDIEWVLIVVGAIFAYYIAHCFISIYEMAIDTIFVCFCEDCEMNDGVTKQYFMSKGLMEFVKKSKKFDKKHKTE